jgi:hypothetical protein
MERLEENFFRFPILDKLPHVHYCNPLGDVPHDTQIVRDQEVRQIHIRLKFREQVKDLSLYADV